MGELARTGTNACTKSTKLGVTGSSPVPSTQESFASAAFVLTRENGLGLWPAGSAADWRRALPASMAPIQGRATEIRPILRIRVFRTSAVAERCLRPSPRGDRTGPPSCRLRAVELRIARLLRFAPRASELANRSGRDR